MIAKVEGEKSMVIIERISHGIYSMCTLKKDLKVKDVRMVAKAAKEKDSTYVRTTNDAIEVDGEVWWRRMMIGKVQLGERQQVSLQFLSGQNCIEYIQSQ